MENMVMDIKKWQRRTVFITGHSGFKGSWLSLWLSRLGAAVTGYSLDVPTKPALFEQARLAEDVESVWGDIRNFNRLNAAMQQVQPEVVFHLAAQPLVQRSYQNPPETWAVNVTGTANLLEAVRLCPSVKAAIVVTTDKCYENNEWPWGYREIDRLGGHDPYSASKAATELVVGSYRKSFFCKSHTLLASARAGNVIGGGDWGDDRLIPDAVRAIAAGKTMLVRNPAATRPWQHVLDCLHGYLLLATRLLDGDSDCATAFNFGPYHLDNISVSCLLARMNNYWPELHWEAECSQQVHESQLLYLDASLAGNKLGWKPRWELEKGITKTVDWYQNVIRDDKSAYILTRQQLEEYIQR